MPELPEVETVRRGLVKKLTGARIARVEARRPDLRFPLPEQFSERLSGAVAGPLERRAKYLILPLSTGDDLVMHLGMTGRFTLVGQTSVDAPGSYIYPTGGQPVHDHVIIHFDDGRQLVYNDPRRFGFMMIVPRMARAQHKLFAHLGVEPLGAQWNAEFLAERGGGKKTNLKSFLMDQRNVAGLGNIYVSEALHDARLSPNRLSSSLADRRGRATVRAHRLAMAVPAVLEKAILAGGSTLRDYRQSDGRSGAFQDNFQVYNRDGKACLREACGGAVQRVVHTGRATFYCNRCQR